ncbi:MAG: type II toxin-antitoxin system VapC family toxin [Chloroflexi bacterium]|nr:type II toxin-antitoxin system VapC family toxin [Chloroflexota bacterium]
MSVVDASVIVAVVNPEEPFHSECRSWLGEVLLSGQKVYAPVIILAELGAALSRGQNDQNLAQRVIGFLSQETM